MQVQWVTGVGRDRHLSVNVNAPSGLLLSTVDDSRGQISFQAQETGEVKRDPDLEPDLDPCLLAGCFHRLLSAGFYQMCFSNFHNRFGGLQVFLSFGVYYNDGSRDSAHLKEEEQKKKEEVSRELNDTLSVIEVSAARPRGALAMRLMKGGAVCLQSSTHRVEVHVFHMFRYYTFGRMRKSADHFLLLSNSQYVSWWSAALSLLILTSGYLQLLFLKRLFITTASGEEARPRC